MLPSLQRSFWLYFSFGIANLAQVKASSPAALSIPPSQTWDGNDGFWSTFLVQIGTPGQPVRLVPGTSANAGSSTWAVIPQGCSLANPELTACGDDRGYLFRSNESTSWSTEGLPNGPRGVLYSLITLVESMLGLSGTASYGYDNISLGLPGSGLPTIEHQLVAGFATNTFWLGSLGLSPWPFNFTDFDHPIPSLLGSLRRKALIPSTSWAYTAGAHYKDPPVFGSLTLGGYDKARLQQESSNLTSAFGADTSKDLLVGLDSITHDTAGGLPLLTDNISIFIDSLVTDLWLPVSVCHVFEQQFGLTWNSTLQRYLVDDNTHDALVAQNPTFTFHLSNSGGSESTEIRFPYAAFDLELTAPLVDVPTRYFPLKQAHNETQYVLGRAFLQEAYVIADYDRRQFSIAQASFPTTAVSPKIVSIYPPDHQPPTTADEQADQAKKGKEGLSAGVIAGIVLGAVSVAGLAAVLVWLLLRRRSKRPSSEGGHGSSEIAEKRREDGFQDSAVYTDDDTFDVNELDADEAWRMEHPRRSTIKRRSELDGTVNPRELESPELVAAELEAPLLK